MDDVKVPFHPNPCLLAFLMLEKNEFKKNPDIIDEFNKMLQGCKDKDDQTYKTGVFFKDAPHLLERFNKLMLPRLQP